MKFLEKIMNRKKYISLMPLFFLSFFIMNFTGLPDKVKPIKNFEVDKYLGTWYEIARIDNPVEKGLQKVYATYSKKTDGKFEFITKGYSEKKKEWKTIKSKAKFAKTSTDGYFKVYYLGPFYTSYAIFEIGKNYEYAFVAGYNESSLWLLSRKKQIDQSVIDHFLKKSKELGFKTEKLLFIKH